MGDDPRAVHDDRSELERRLIRAAEIMEGSGRGYPAPLLREAATRIGDSRRATGRGEGAMTEDWTLESLAGLVARMRSAQVNFYRHRRRATPEQHRELLEAALQLEASVDVALVVIGDRRPLFDRPR